MAFIRLSNCLPGCVEVWTSGCGGISPSLARAAQPRSAASTDFKPSEQLDRPYVMAGVNVFAADTAEEAHEQFQGARRTRAANLFGRRTGQSPSEISDAQAEELLASGAAMHVDEMLTYSAIGTVADVRKYLEEFAARIAADELVTVHQVPRIEARLRSVTLLAEAMRGV